MVITLSAGQVSQLVVFALAGFSMSASYNLLLTAEALFAHVAA